MIRYLFLMAFLLCNKSLLFSQKITEDTLRARQLLEVETKQRSVLLDNYKEAAQIYQQYNLDSLYCRTKLIAENYQSTSDIAALRARRKQLREEISGKLGNKHPYFIESLFLLAETHQIEGESDKYIEYLLSIDKELNSIDYPEGQISTYLRLSSAYIGRGDVQRTFDYILQAEKLARKTPNSTGQLIQSLRIKAYILSLTDQAKEAFKVIDEAIALAQKRYSNQPEQLLLPIKMKASIYYVTGQHGKGIELLKALYEEQREVLGEDNQWVGNLLLDIGVYYKDWRQAGDIPPQEFDVVRAARVRKAAEYILRAAAIYPKHGVDVSILYRNLVYVYLEEQATPDYEKALEAAHKSMMALLPNKTEADPYTFFEIAGTDTRVLDQMYLVSAIESKVNTLRAMYEDDVQMNKLQIKWVDEMIAIMQSFKKELADDALGDVYYMLNRNIHLGLGVLATLHKVDPNPDYLAQAFKHFERNKNTRLLSSLRSMEDKNLGDIPQAIRAEEEALKKQILENRKKLLDAAEVEDSVAVEKYVQKRFELNAAYDAFLRKLEKEAPQYHQLKYEAELPNIKELQAQLDGQTAVLEYYLFSNSLQTLVITQDEVQFFTKEDFDRGAFDETFKQMRESLTSVHLLDKEGERIYKQYTENAYKLYSEFLQLDDLLINQDIKKLIIIPSERLNYLPFETLLCSEPKQNDQNYAGLDYLVKHYAVSYAYSAAVLLQNLKHQSSGTKGVLGFAASYNVQEDLSDVERSSQLRGLRKVLTDLPGAQDELKKLKEHYAGDFYLGKTATELAFKQVDFEGYNVVHLAMHGLLDAEQPFASSLAFTEDKDTSQDNFVFAYELTQLDIPADLVILSACETGFGKFNYGEGVASLGRAFMYAGAPSLVMTLWEVNDLSTAEIMKQFYAGLHEGQSKSEALQAAKLGYLNRAEGVSGHPFFWAPFVNLGNPEPITLRSKDYYRNRLLSIGGVFLLLLLLGALRFRKKE